MPAVTPAGGHSVRRASRQRRAVSEQLCGMRVLRWLLLSRALASAPHDHVLYVNEECGQADATSAAHGAWRCADGSALPPPVVVVGSDGSGTRVVAKALSLMGVTMLVERALYTQMDLDGSDAGVHFTSTIRALLVAAHSSVYDPLSLPTAARSSAILAAWACCVSAAEPRPERARRAG